MDKLVGNQRILSHKDLLAWTVRRFRAVAGVEEEEEDEEAKTKAKRAAAERRRMIMAKMQAQQKTFMADNATLFEEAPGSGREHKQSECEWEVPPSSSSPVCLGPSRSHPTPLETSYTCILCQEEEQVSPSTATLVMASYVQRSTVLARRRGQSTVVQDPATFPFVPSDLSVAPHTSSCGHVMHASCWQKYFDDVAESERRRYRARHPTSFDVDKQEFLCPLCRSLSNSVVPLIPQYHLLQQPSTPAPPEEAGVVAVGEETDTMEPTALSTTVTVVSSSSPPSSSTTELASAASLSSDSTFMSVEAMQQEPRETFADTAVA